MEEFDKLQEENNNLRMKLSSLIIELTPEEQTELLRLVNNIVNIEIELEKFCGE